jgi:pilus assembly protein CpaE
MMSNLAFDEERPNGAEGAAGGDGHDLRPVPRISIQAFCESQELGDAVTAAASDRRMARAHVKVHAGGIAAATEFYGSAPTPNLVIVESTQAGERLIAELEQLANVCDAGTKVVVVGRVNDVELYRDLQRRGVSEYVVAPVPPIQIISTISNLYSEPGSDPLGRSVAFIGGKGGVGSSVVSHCVAFALAQQLDADVLLADLDLSFGTAGLDFNQDPTQGIAEAIHSPDRLDDVFLDRLLARCTDHLSLLAAPATLDRTFDLGETAVEPVIDLAQASVPTVVLDLPHVWSSWVKHTLVAADDIVITVEPDLANLRNAKNMIDLLGQLRKNDRPPLLVINKVGMAKRPEIKVEEFAKAIEMEPIAVIPFDAHLFGTAANNGQVIAEVDPKSSIAESFNVIAQAVSGRSEIRRAKRQGLLAKLRGKKAGKSR